MSDEATIYNDSPLSRAFAEAGRGAMAECARAVWPDGNANVTSHIYRYRAGTRVPNAVIAGQIADWLSSRLGRTIRVSDLWPAATA